MDMQRLGRKVPNKEESQNKDRNVRQFRALWEKSK